MKQNLVVAVIYLVFAVCMRIFSFFPLTIDHDESTYIVIAEEMMRGSVYWVDIIDTKPPGIFMFYCLLLTLAGKSIFIIRLLVAIWIAFTAYGIYRISLNWIKKGNGPWIAGILYIIMTSVFTFLGVSPNSELFFSGFTVWALYLLVVYRYEWWSGILAGFFLGIGITIKQVAVFDALPMGIFLFTMIYAEKQKIKTAFIHLALITFAAFLPSIGIAVWYFESGFGENWHFYMLTAAGRYPAENTVWQMIRFTGDFLLRFFPITIMSFLAVSQWRTFRSLQFYYLMYWAVFVVAGVIIPGNSYYHYFIQLMPPLCILAGWVLHEASEYSKRIESIFTPTRGWIMLSVLLITNGIFQYKDYFMKHDYRREVYETIKQSESESPILYIGDVGYQILYFLLDQRPPGKYLHPSLMWESKHIINLEIDQDAELKKIMDLRPEFCLADIRRNHGVYDRFLAENYTPLDTLKSSVVLYRINRK
jgi:4-amino-4-deoxy-L-arabinose transferase-like glycosyltransferase